MLLLKRGQNQLFQFPALNRLPGVTHAITTRAGGASQPPFDGMNLSFGVGDDPVAVTANRRWLHRLTGGIHVYSRQNHGITVGVITRQTLGDRDAAIRTAPVAADALITDVPGIRLLIQTADCQAVMLVDPVKRVVANVHSGWRGSVANIIGHTVARMVTGFGCDPGRMTAAIGPSLGPCCAEFVNYRAEIPEPLWRFRVGAHHFDFWRISRHQLVAAGLSTDNLYGADICTRCNPHLFYSYRASRETGRLAALIGLDEPVGGNR
ncbi:laccase domain protein [Desulfosarcina ovata subsp. sediminis]|uniref:Laccase domain protein n=1 Tax=Desulfosarcina ovata subsp. sediminis TaxID=885957 RepID=A0A5K8A284_9BACT|nr:polyphenol oxidase family protein [Desulfosarcina ovata]BBO86663.1 laccase domain protein [Desulfosarcina ovata subsp. sediminis]